MLWNYSAYLSQRLGKGIIHFAGRYHSETSIRLRLRPRLTLRDQHPQSHIHCRHESQAHMANLFLLDCSSCNHQLTVSPRQAGQSLTCTECSTQIDAPKLGDLKKLPPASVPATAGDSRKMSATGRWLFTIGLALAVIAGVTGFGLQRFASSLKTELDIDAKLAENRESLYKLSPAEIYYFASSIERNDRVGDYAEPSFVKDNIQGTILSNIAYGIYAIAAVGLVMLLAAFFK